jgi:TolB-like protein/class 3 adenylate cyclase
LTDNHVERRLAAILAADVAGYSRLTGLDEEGTHVRLRERLRDLVDPKISEHHGKVVKTTGDGMLAEFGSVVDAVRCAIEVQRGMAEQNATMAHVKRIEFRIGVHVGDIIFDANDIFGDAVNITARLEGIAEPGGVCISDDAQRQIRGKVDIALEDIGPQNLKNIVEPMRAWRLRTNASTSAATSIKPGVETAHAPALPDKPSIAVLPFQNMSGDPEQEYFADGVVEEIITVLSRFKALFVIARNSSFTYKGHAVDVKQVGRELGVRYILEGSVRKAANRVRIASQLIDAETGAHLWADSFDGALEDVFDLQDRVSVSVVGAIAPTVILAEIKRAERKPTENLRAYDHYLRGLASVGLWTSDGTSKGLNHFRKAIELDPNLAAAYAMAAWCYVRRRSHGCMDDPTAEISEATRLARKAVHLGKDRALALCMGGYVLGFFDRDFDDAAAFIDRSLVLNPNSALAWTLSAWTRVWRGEPDLAIEHAAKAERLSPLDPSMFSIQAAAAYAHFLVHRYDVAASLAEKARCGNPNFVLGTCISAASNALAGRFEVAQRAIARALECDPDLRLSNLKNVAPFRRSEDFAIFAGGLSKAGLPD